MEANNAELIEEMSDTARMAKTPHPFKNVIIMVARSQTTKPKLTINFGMGFSLMICGWE